MLKLTVSGKTGEGKSSLIEHIRIALLKVGYSITNEKVGEPGITSIHPRGSKQEVRIIEEFSETSEEEVDQVVRYAEVYFNKKELSNIEIIEANAYITFFLCGRHGEKPTSYRERKEAVDDLIDILHRRRQI